MGTEAIVARILSDAEAEAEKIVREAEESAAARKAEASARAKAAHAEAEAEVAERARRISEGRAASARLDSGKALLAEKRRVLDEIYLRALRELLTLSRHDSLQLMERLLKENAEEGDEVVFASDFAYAGETAALPVVKALGLRISQERAGEGGGCLLRGKTCDKDLTFRALLAQDREAHQAEIAAKLFRIG